MMCSLRTEIIIQIEHRFDAASDDKLQLFIVDATMRKMGSKDNSRIENGAPSRSGSLSRIRNESKVVDPETFADRLALLKDARYEDPMATQVFSALQTMSAGFMSFTHGTNDTA